VSPRKAGSFLVTLAAAVPLLSCATPTQVTVVVTTDVPCEFWKGTTVSVGTQETIESPFYASSTPTCTESKEGIRIGEIVVVPKVNRNDKFTIKVVGGVDTTADACVKTGDYTGCIVARRSLNFIPHAALELPIFLSSSCEGVPCSTRKNETCVFGACASADIPKPELCEDKPEACGEQVLTGEGTPAPVQELVECGRPSLIADDFASKEPRSKWAVQGSDKEAAQVEGALVLTPPADGAQEVAFRSEHSVKLDGDAITVRVPGMLSVEADARAYLAAEYNSVNQVRIEQRKGALHFLSTDAMGALTGPSVPYDSQNHLWWEIRATAKNIVMRTSPDGLDWTLGASIPKESVAHFADHVNIVLGAGVETPGSSPGSVAFDDLNQGRSIVVWCPLSEVADTFDGANPTPKWRVDQTNEDCQITQKEGSLFFDITGNEPTTCSLQTRSAFNLRGKSLVLNVEALSIVEPNVNFFLSVEDDRRFGAEIGVRVSQEFNLKNKPVVFYLRRPETLNIEQGEVAINPMAPPKFLRIRESGGLLYWETSDTGAKWTELRRDAPGFATNAAHVSIRFESFEPLVTKPLSIKVADLTVKSAGL
jgi:hypothetical protein